MKIKVLIVSVLMIFSFCSYAYASTGVTTDCLNFRDDEGELICAIPAGTVINIQDDSYDMDRVSITWNGITGNVLSDYVEEETDFIYVDIEDQLIYLYIDANLICVGPTVTGTPETDRETPKGVFHIQYMDTNLYLGSDDYYVERWISFLGEYGIHDADYWRDDYGGDIYLYDGSHGCVNTPSWISKIIFEYSDIGMLVIIR